MKRNAIKMHLHPGQEQEYRRRHDEIWPELKRLLSETGITDYSIFLDEETNTLFGVWKEEDSGRVNSLPNHPVMKRWWAYMKDIMDSREDNSPVTTPLREVFHLP